MSDVGSGDRLARGNVSATWGVNNVSKERWDSIFGEDSGPKLNNEESNSSANGKPSGATSADVRKSIQRKK